MGSGLHGGFGGTRGSRGNYQIHKGKQDKHIPGTKNYQQQIANGKHPSILTENAANLLKDPRGKIYSKVGNKEGVDFGRVIGKYYSVLTEKYYDTTRAMIHYDSNGYAHIVPAKPEDLK